MLKPILICEHCSESTVLTEHGHRCCYHGHVKVVKVWGIRYDNKGCRVSFKLDAKGVRARRK